MPMFLSLALAFLSLGIMAATAADLRLFNTINTARIDLAHVHAVPDGQSGDGPDRLEGQIVAPGEENRLEIPGDACRLHLRLVWIDGTSANMTHNFCSESGPLSVQAR